MQNRPVRTYVQALVLLALAILPYLNSLWNGFTIDDFFAYADNAFIRSWHHWPDLFTQAYFTGSNEASYRPFCTLTYFLDWSLWQRWPAGPHLTNVALYAATVLAVFSLFRRLLPSPRAAFCGAALFALHPLHTEVVNSISFREDLLVALLLTLSWLAFDRGQSKPVGALVPSARTMGASSWLYFPLAWACYALATLAKESAIIFPALALVLAWVAGNRNAPEFHRAPPNRRALPIYMAGLAALTLLFLLLRFRWMQFPLEGNQPQLGGSLLGTLLADVRIQAHYLRLLFLPAPLSAYYPPDAYALRPAAPFAIAAATLAALVAACWHWRRSALLLGAVAWWFISLAPVANFYPIYNPMAERYTYLASIGPCWLAGALLARALESRHRRIAQAAALALALAWGALIVKQNRVWRDDLIVWNSVLPRTHGDPVVLANLAAAHYGAGHLDTATDFANRALTADPAAHPNFSPASAQLPLACIALTRGNVDEAVTLLRAIEPQLPLRFDIDAAVYRNLTLALEARGDAAGALQAVEQAARLEPYQPMHRAKAAYFHLLLHQPERAREVWREAQRLDPRLPPIDMLEAELRAAASVTNSP